jgi:peptide subunit release factor 1 (eRF1)
MPVNAAADEVLRRTLEVQTRMERHQEGLLVQGLIAELHEGGKALAHLAPVVDAVNQGRIWKLIYSKGFTASGGECDGCGAYTLDSSGSCELCGGNLSSAQGFVDRLSQGVAEQGGSVEVVHDDAAEQLEPLGSIAALLRY